MWVSRVGILSVGSRDFCHTSSWEEKSAPSCLKAGVKDVSDRTEHEEPAVLKKNDFTFTTFSIPPWGQFLLFKMQPLHTSLPFILGMTFPPLSLSCPFLGG